MKCPFCFFFALGLATLQTCQPAHAGPVEDYAGKRFREGVLDAYKIRHELAQPVVLLATNAAPARVRTQVEKDLITLLLAQGLTASQVRNAPDRDKLIDDTMRAKLTSGTAAQQAAAAVATCHLQLLRAAIARQGRSLPAETADEPQPDVVTQSLGQPLYQTLGLPELPTVDAIAGAMK